MQIDEQGRLTAKHGPNGHADRFWGLALAIHAAQTVSIGSCAAETFSLPSFQGSMQIQRLTF